MAKFAQYYIKYHNEPGSYDWDDRQKQLSHYFEKDDSIEFSSGDEGKGKKIYNHRVYHLACNPDIIVMQFANSIDIPIEKNYQELTARDEPSCFVIIDNRANLRTIAIQKRKRAFSKPDQVAKILSTNLSDQFYHDKCYTMDILPEFYPEDLFEAWSKLQMNIQAIRFGVPEMTCEEIMQKVELLKSQGKEYFDDSLMAPLLQLAFEAKMAKYRHFYTVAPDDKKMALYVDKSTAFMKNLITMSRASGMPVELVTNEGASFRCFVDADEDNTDKIVYRELNSDSLEQLFSRRKKNKEPLNDDDINTIEQNVVEMLNTMKHDVEDDNAMKVA